MKDPVSLAALMHVPFVIAFLAFVAALVLFQPGGTKR